MISIKLPHDKVNFVWSTDWHLSANPPGRRTDDYKVAILTKLEFIRSLAEKINGVALCGGDVFHIKNPDSKSNNNLLLVDTINTLSRFPNGCVYGSIGNHDLQYDRMDSLEKQPLGILIAAGVYHNLNVESVLFSNDSESLKVSVETFSYAEGDVTLQRLLDAGKRPSGVKYRVGVVHAYGEDGNGGFLYNSPKIGYNQVKDIDFDYLLWGHDHSRKETVTVGNVTHINLGSLARAAFPTDEEERPVTVAILSFAEDGIRYKEKVVPVTPLEIAFTVEDKPMEKVDKSEKVLEFLAEIDQQVEGITTNDAREVLAQLCPAEEPELLQLVMELCEL